MKFIFLLIYLGFMFYRLIDIWDYSRKFGGIELDEFSVRAIKAIFWPVLPLWLLIKFTFKIRN